MLLTVADFSAYRKIALEPGFVFEEGCREDHRAFLSLFTILVVFAFIDQFVPLGLGPDASAS
jgi:hypothetical protein